MSQMGYNYTSSNHIKSRGMLEHHHGLFSTYVMGIDTMSDHTSSQAQTQVKNPNPRKWTVEHYRTIGFSRGIEWMGQEYPRNILVSTAWRCLNCGHKWNTSFHNIKNGAGCKACSVNSARTSESQYIEYAKTRNILYLGGYCGNVLSPVEWECFLGHRWRASFASVQSGSGCPDCANCRKRTEDEYKVAGQACGLTYLGGYSGNVKAKVQWKCEQGHVFDATYDHVINKGRGCGICSPTRVKDESEYRQLAESLGFKYVGGYSGSVLEPVEWRCGVGHVWKARYDNINHGRGCPICRESIGEKAVASVLDNLGIAFERQKRFPSCRLHKPLPFDFCFRVNAVDYLCEYDGIQHFESMEWRGGEAALRSIQKRDRIKDEWAKQNGYTLIRVPHTVEDVQGFLADKLNRFPLLGE